jgi:diguanylate cyclase (GGDEF)-like protein
MPRLAPHRENDCGTRRPPRAGRTRLCNHAGKKFFPGIPSMLYRLRSEFRLSIIVLFGAAAVLGILPLAVYRLLTGDMLIGMVDGGIVLCVCVTVLYAWRTGDTQRAGWFLVTVNFVVGILMTHRLGASALPAMFTVLVSSFLLIDRRKAAVIAVLALAIVAVDDKAFASPAHLVAFVVNGVLVSLFAFIFAARAEVQRRQLEMLATHDSLTGLHNRRAMEEELRIAVETYRRNQMRFGLAMLDLDHFKRVNDDHGHEAGDQILIAFAGILRNSTRKVDRVFRYGGEEFVMLFPGVDFGGLRTVTTNLRARICAELRSPGGTVTTSIGAALLMPDEDEHAWLARVDAALYEAKATGRDRVVMDGREEFLAPVQA